MTATLPSLAQLKPNPNWAKLPLFDRKGWTRVRFDDVVENLNETCDPAEAGLERIIAMEHLEPGSLHIRAWGNVSDGTTFTRRCRPGQVLFGKRRAYQRKVAVAEFDAVVSGDIYVLAPKGDRLLPELLPFLCLSERFYQHAVGTSAGSLSPRTNWSSLASFEFDLPPLDQQRRIAEILWAVDETVTQFEAMLHAGENLMAATRNEVSNGNCPMKCLEDIATLITKGESPGWQGFDYQKDGSVFVTSENVLFGRYEPEPRKHIPMEFHQKLRRSALQKDDVLFNIVGASIGRGCVLPELGKPANVNQAVAVIRLDQKMAKPEFILGHLLSPKGMKDILGTAVNTARANISLDSLRKTKIPLPPVKIQIELCERLDALYKAKASVTEQIESICSVRSAFLNQVFQKS
jgi:restriction endonuclease S subunit